MNCGTKPTNRQDSTTLDGADWEEAIGFRFSDLNARQNQQRYRGKPLHQHQSLNFLLRYPELLLEAHQLQY